MTSPGSGRSSRRYFDDVARRWDSLRSGFFSTIVREEVLDTLGLENGHRVADVGAGTGFMAEALVTRGARVVAIDESLRMLGQLRAKFGTTVACIVGNGRSLPVADASVSCAVANMYLHHVDAPGEALREMVRIVQPGRGIAVSDLDAHRFSFLRAEHHDRWLGFHHEEIRSWLERAGAVDIRIRSIDTTCNAVSASGKTEASIGIFLAVGRRPSSSRSSRRRTNTFSSRPDGRSADVG